MSNVECRMSNEDGAAHHFFILHSTFDILHSRFPFLALPCPHEARPHLSRVRLCRLRSSRAAHGVGRCHRLPARHLPHAPHRHGESRSAHAGVSEVDPGRAHADGTDHAARRTSCEGAHDRARMVARPRRSVRVPCQRSGRSAVDRRRFRLHVALFDLRRRLRRVGQRHAAPRPDPLQPRRALPCGHRHRRSHVQSVRSLARRMEVRHGAPDRVTGGGPHRLPAGLTHDPRRLTDRGGGLPAHRADCGQRQRARDHHRRLRVRARGERRADRQHPAPGRRDGRALRRAALPALHVVRHAERSRRAAGARASRVDRHPAGREGTHRLRRDGARDHDPLSRVRPLLER